MTTKENLSFLINDVSLSPLLDQQLLVLLGGFGLLTGRNRTSGLLLQTDAS